MKASIAVLGGDGIGPEVVAEGVRCLERRGRSASAIEFTLTQLPFGGAAIDRPGEPLPPDTLAACLASGCDSAGCHRRSEVVGARCESAPGAGLAADCARSSGVYANLRPVKLHPCPARVLRRCKPGGPRGRRSDVRARAHRRHLFRREDAVTADQRHRSVHLHRGRGRAGDPRRLPAGAQPAPQVDLHRQVQRAGDLATVA